MTTDQLIRAKLAAMRDNLSVIVSAADMDQLERHSEDIRSVRNPDRVGVLDAYVAWIGPNATDALSATSQGKERQPAAQAV